MLVESHGDLAAGELLVALPGAGNGQVIGEAALRVEGLNHPVERFHDLWIVERCLGAGLIHEPAAVAVPPEPEIGPSGVEAPALDDVAVARNQLTADLAELCPIGRVQRRAIDACLFKVVQVEVERTDIGAARDAVELTVIRCLLQRPVVEHRRIVAVALDELGQRLQDPARRPGCRFEPAEPDHVRQGVRCRRGEKRLLIERFDDVEVDVGIGFLECEHPGAGQRIGLLDAKTPLGQITGRLAERLRRCLPHGAGGDAGRTRQGGARHR